MIVKWHNNTLCICVLGLFHGFESKDAILEIPLRATFIYFNKIRAVAQPSKGLKVKKQKIKSHYYISNLVRRNYVRSFYCTEILRFSWYFDFCIR